MKNIKMVLFFLILLIVLSGCFKIPLGDGESMDISSDGVTISDEEGKETTISMDEENESLNISNDDGEEMESSIGENAEIPEEFPIKDFPIPEDATVTLAQELSNDDGIEIMVSYQYDGDLERLIEMYQDHFENGDFEEVNSQKLGEDGDEVRSTSISAIKDGNTFFVQISTMGDDTTIALMYQEENE